MSSVNIRKETLSRPIIVDGIGRSGKFFLAKLLCGIENIEYFQYVSILEHIPFIYRLGFINKKAAISLLQINADEHSYNMLAGRNLNLRFDDGSSIINSLEKSRYIKRSNKFIDNDKIRIDKNPRYSPFITHEAFPNIDIFFEAFPKVKILLLRRNPIDLVHSWLLRGWGSRFENSDKLAFIPLINNKKFQFPWYVDGWEEEYYLSSEIDRIIKCIDIIMGMEAAKYNDLTKEQKNKILIIRYENLVQKTNVEISRLEDFTHNKKSSRMPKIMTNEKCPNKIEKKNREKKLDEILLMASNKYIDLLLSRVADYESAQSIM